MLALGTEANVGSFPGTRSQSSPLHDMRPCVHEGRPPSMSGRHQEQLKFKSPT